MNRKGNAIKAMFLLSSLVLCLGLFTCGRAAYASDAEDALDVSNPDMTVSVEVGLDGVVVEDVSSNVTIKVNNQGKDFQGTLRLIVPGGGRDGNAVAYEKALTVPQGGEKSVTMTIADICSATFVRVELETEKGKIIQSAQYQTAPADKSQNIILGILSSDYSALSYFDGIAPMTNTGTPVATRVLQLNADNIPEDSNSLGVCEVILIDNYNTSQLSEAQRDALIGWVSNGGTIIFGTGAKGGTTLEGFQDTLAPVQLGSVKKENVVIANSYDTEAKAVDVVDISGVDDWFRLTDGIASNAPVYQSRYGAGSVVIMSYDLSMEPIVSWNSSKGTLAENLISQSLGTADPSRWANGYSIIDDFEDCFGAVDGNRAPSALLYAGVFLLYVLAIGPIMYVILRKKDKREWMWVIIPAMSLIFTLIVFATSMFYRIRRPFVDEVAIVEYQPGAVRTQSVFQLQSPKSKAYDVEVNKEYREVSPQTQSYGSSTDKYSCVIRDNGDHTNIKIPKGNAFMPMTYKATKTAALQGTGFDTDLTYHMDGATGTVTNNTGYTLKNVIICYGTDYFAVMGDMAPGATVTLDGTMWDDYVSYDLEEWIGEEPRNLLGLETNDKDYRIKNACYNAMDSWRKNFTVSDWMIFGMIDDYESDLVDGFKVKDYSCGLVCQQIFAMPEEYAQYASYVDDLDAYLVGGDNIAYDTSKYPEGYDSQYLYGDHNTIYAGSEVNYLYDIGMLLPYLSVENSYLISDEAVASHAPTEEDLQTPDTSLDDWNYEDYEEWMQSYLGASGEYAGLRLYNWQTGTYEERFTGIDDAMVPLADYVSPEGWIAIQYSAPDTGSGEFILPKVSLAGGEN